MPIRVFLVALNFYIFIMLNFFLTLFTVQVLKRNYFPFQKLSDICQYDGDLITDSESADIFGGLNASTIFII